MSERPSLLGPIGCDEQIRLYKEFRCSSDTNGTPAPDQVVVTYQSSDPTRRSSATISDLQGRGLRDLLFDSRPSTTRGVRAAILCPQLFEEFIHSSQRVFEDGWRLTVTNS